jgi:hypothetical protein
MLYVEDAAEVHHHTIQTALQEVPNRQEQVFLEGDESRGHRGGNHNYQQEVEGTVGESSRQVIKWGRGAGSGGAER